MKELKLVTHEGDDGLKMVEIETQKPVFCQICLEMFYSETQLQKHIESHQEPNCQEPKYDGPKYGEPNYEEPKYECNKR